MNQDVKDALAELYLQAYIAAVGRKPKSMRPKLEKALSNMVKLDETLISLGDFSSLRNPRDRSLAQALVQPSRDNLPNALNNLKEALALAKVALETELAEEQKRGPKGNLGRTELLWSCLHLLAKGGEIPTAATLASLGQEIHRASKVPPGQDGNWFRDAQDVLSEFRNKLPESIRQSILDCGEIQ
jgi:hypothetical protein